VLLLRLLLLRLLLLALLLLLLYLRRRLLHIYMPYIPLHVGRLMRVAVALEEKHPPRLMLHREAISAVIEGKKHNNMGGNTQTTRHDTVQDHAFLLLYCDLTS
jgi:uncharacterized protein (DUF58 family)